MSTRKIRNQDGSISEVSNPLAKYATYNYHQILILCDNTSTARSLSKLTGEPSAMFNVNPTLGDPAPPGSKIAAIQTIKTLEGTDGEFVVISNSMQSCRYSINRASWKSTVFDSAHKNGISFATTFAEEGELEIHEPMGVSFYNMISDVIGHFGVEPSGVVMLLKTIFMGNPDHASDNVDIRNVRPLMFIMTDIRSSFGVTGSNHTLSFVSANNGFAKSPQITSLGTDTRMVVDLSDSSLKTVFTILETSLNARYARFIERLNKKAVESGCEIISGFRQLKYEIHLHDEYKTDGFKLDIFDDWIRISDQKLIVTFGRDCNIEGAIDHIVLKSSGMVRHKNEKTGNNKIHKIFSEIVTTEELMTIRYYIVPFEIHTLKPGSEHSEEEKQELDLKTIEFDYIFTGRNVDIEENGIDMKMDMGYTYFHVMSSYASLPRDAATAYDHVKSVQPVLVFGATSTHNKMRNSGGGTETRATLFPGGVTHDMLGRLSGDRKWVTQQRAMLSGFAAISNLATSITIAGNPDLIAGPDYDEGNAKLPSDFNRLMNIPTYAKVHVKYPDSQYPDGNYTISDFWFTGYYLIMGIDNSFEGGLFKQTLDLISIPVENSLADMGAGTAAKKSDCFAEILAASGKELRAEEELQEAREVLVSKELAKYQPLRPELAAAFEEAKDRISSHVDASFVKDLAANVKTQLEAIAEIPIAREKDLLDSVIDWSTTKLPFYD